MLQNISSALVDHGKYIVAVPNLCNPLFYMALSNDDVPDMYTFTMSKLITELQHNDFKILESGFLFVASGFEQWIKGRWLVFPIKLIDMIYFRLPLLLQKTLAAHLYCVGEKI